LGAEPLTVEEFAKLQEVLRMTEETIGFANFATSIVGGDALTEIVGKGMASLRDTISREINKRGVRQDG
jgi:hypothetical protein